MSRKSKKRSGGRGGIFILFYFGIVVALSFVFQYKVIKGHISLELIPGFLRENIFKNITWFVMIVSLLFFFGLFVIRSKVLKGKFKVEDRYYSKIPTVLPPSAAAILYEDEPTFPLGAEFAYFIEKGYVEIVELEGRTTFKAIKYPTELEGMWKYQISMFDMFFRTISGNDGVIDLEDLKRLEQTKNMVGKYLLNFVQIMFSLEDELKEKGYVSNGKRAFLDFEGMSSMLPFLPIFYLCIGFVITHKFFISIPMIIYFILSMSVCKNRTGKKDTLTKKGIEEYNKIASFRMFLENYTITEDRGLEDLKILRMFLVYASALGFSDRVANEIAKYGVRDVFASIMKPIFNIKINKNGF